MARGTQHRKRRPPANAAVTAPAPKKDRVQHARWEDQLFFSRLRVHAKWMFALLAAVFGLTFVFFGVGSGSSGIADMMQNFFSSSSSSGSSLSSLQKKAREHPKDAIAWRNLVTKLEQDQKTDRALVALEHYVKLKPKDESAFEEIGGMYARRAQEYDYLWAQALSELQIVSPTGLFAPRSGSPLTKALAGKDPINTVTVTRLKAKVDSASKNVGIYANKAEQSYERLVKLSPQNATYQFQLADMAHSLSMTAVAKKAYETFLKLAPNDSLAPRAREQLKSLSAPPAKK